MDKASFFTSLGFKEYESKTIISLLKLKTATTKEISFESGVPQNKLYNILKKFENLGIVEIIPQKLKKFKLINLKTFINKKIKEQEVSVKKLKQNSKSLQELKEPEEQALFSIIKGQQTIMNKIAETNSRVKKEIFGVQRNWKVWGKGLREARSAVKRGISMKFIGVINKETKKRAEEWKKTGCKIRVYNEKFGKYPLRFTIFDNNEARITVGKPEINDPENYITVWTKSKPLINILRKQFLQMWKECKSFQSLQSKL
jgi:sugar-specific transcriptional regulator TrmB